LAGIKQIKDIVRPGDFSDPGCWIDQPALGRDMGEGNQPGARCNGRFQFANE
jgi:hypothetical protein